MALLHHSGDGSPRTPARFQTQPQSGIPSVRGFGPPDEGSFLLGLSWVPACPWRSSAPRPGASGGGSVRSRQSPAAPVGAGCRFGWRSVIRATVSPPTAMQPGRRRAGHRGQCDGDVRGRASSGTYGPHRCSGPRRRRRPPESHTRVSRPLRIVRPKGRPSRTRRRRAARRSLASRCGRRPSLRSNSPLAGTTSLTVVPVVPAARQTEAERQVVLCSTPSPEGTDASAHVWPPSALTATAPCSVAVAGRYVAGVDAGAAGHAREVVRRQEGRREVALLLPVWHRSRRCGRTRSRCRR